MRKPLWTSIPTLAPHSSTPTSAPTPPFSWTPHEPVVRQISHKGGAKDQDDGEAKEEDDPHVPDIYNRIPVVAMRVGVLWKEKRSIGLPATPRSLMLAMHPLFSNFSSNQSPLAP